MTLTERITTTGPEAFTTEELLALLLDMPPDIVLPQLFEIILNKPVTSPLNPLPEITPEQLARCMALGELISRYDKRDFRPSRATPSS